MFKRLLLSVATFVFALIAAGQETKKIMLVIHGGAGTINRSNMTADREKEYRAALEQALHIGQAVLVKGGTSLDAVEASVRFMEDSPLFNAGKGAVFTHEGKNELDAAIMDGKTKKAGSVAGVTIIKNPITAARAVMEKSQHVMMASRGAELFATKMGLEIVDPSYFWTERRWKALQDELVKEQQGKPQAELERAPENRFGTVGAVAVDQYGNLAAATSTGGTTNKQYGRIGDSPVIGAGTYADNESCAVSATGTGEYFIRWTVAHEIAALMKYKGLTVQQAADQVINKTLKAVPGADGGVIALDAKGNFAMPFNTEGMYRGWMGADGVAHVSIYGD
ncbi:MAG: beta-aspartyl-peptidase [Acidobacteria bacterium]|nr:MAG: beta-aspartyl-peptidase [Acidobacteriota bacterium]